MEIYSPFPFPSIGKTTVQVPSRAAQQAGAPAETTERRNAQAVRGVAAAAIFLAAALLFELELLLGKFALPWFGGSAQVWIVCLAFFQIELFGSYWYAHVIGHAPSATIRRVHVALVVISLTSLPINPGLHWKPTAGLASWPQLVGMLITSAGLPFFVLAATAPLLQGWLIRSTGSETRAVYRLYSLSNLGALLALAAYPLLIEPLLTLQQQSVSWAVAYVFFAVLIAAAFVAGNAMPDPFATDSPSQTPNRGTDIQLLWFALAFVPAALLAAVTQYMLRDIAPVPLLWAIPLALYLASFVLAFGFAAWYVRPIWYLLAGMAAWTIVSFAGSDYLFGGVRALLVLSNLSLFVWCAVLHAELASLRPEESFLSSFYLSIAAGGAAGALFSAVVAPLIFDSSRYDLLSLIAVALVVLFARIWQCRDRLALGSVIAPAVWVLFAIVLLWRSIDSVVFEPTNSRRIWTGRNFYGSLVVSEDERVAAIDRTRDLLNGNINHGKQFLSNIRRSEPLTYYTHRSGIGLTLDGLGARRPLRVGVIGLGVGTLAAYARRGDRYTFYEIDPAVIDVARRYFWYLADAAGQVRVIPGDARISLENQPPQNFDVLVVDAFTSDAVPTHLLTDEAFALYWSHVRSDGVLAVHVTNRYLDLARVVAGSRPNAGRYLRLVANTEDPKQGGFASQWVLVSTGEAPLATIAAAAPVAVPQSYRPWTDGYSSIWTVMK
jgi:hypothetical protein